MKKLPIYFPTSSATRTFLLLVIGYLLIFTSSIFVFSEMGKLFDASFHQHRIATRIMHLYNFANHMRYTRNMRKFLGPVTQVKISEFPETLAEQIPNPNLSKILAWVVKNPSRDPLALQLFNGQWLNLEPRFPPLHLRVPFIGFSLLALLLLSSLIFLSAWAVKNLVLPFANLSHSISNLGHKESTLVTTGNMEVDKIIKTFNQLQARINKLLGMRTQMLAAISHDLRTPITRLKLRIEYLSDKNQYQKALADLTEMENMITSVLAFTREDVHKGILEEFDLNALLESLSNDFSDVGFKVIYHAIQGRLPFYGCISTLRRAFTNLIDNAIKYGESAKIKLFRDDQFIKIQIDDEGPGIAREQLEQVFEPFYRVEQSRSRQTGGVGLGLSIARDIIFAHQGEIKLLNRKPSGLRVIVTLPLLQK